MIIENLSLLFIILTLLFVKDDQMLNAILSLYGWGDSGSENEAPVASVDASTLLLVQKNLQESYKQATQEKIKKSGYDEAKWERARFFHNVPEETVVKLSLKDQQSSSAKSVSFLQQIWEKDIEASRIEQGFADEERKVLFMISLRS